MKGWGPPTLVHLETALSIWRVGPQFGDRPGPQPLSIWRPPCPKVGGPYCPFQFGGVCLESALSIWRVGGPPNLGHQPETALSIWGPQPLSIWRPPCPFGGLGRPQPLSIWAFGGLGGHLEGCLTNPGGVRRTSQVVRRTPGVVRRTPGSCPANPSPESTFDRV